MSENYLKMEEGREILAGCRVLFYLRGYFFSFFNQHFIDIFRHIEVELVLQKTHMYPLPRSYNYHFTVLVILHICASIYTSIGQFILYFKCISK